MAFALWVSDETAWAAGTHEYRPMGVAIISITDRFRPRDFHATRKSPKSRRDVHFRGLFASLEQLNASLRYHRSHTSRKKEQTRLSRIVPII